jgi:CBS domain containing-hemolysin-like protein
MNPKSFNVGALSLFEAIYFSITTAATVGFGDIVPTSIAARAVVMFEIVLGLMYAVFFFAVIVGELQRSRASTDLVDSVGVHVGETDGGGRIESRELDSRDR